MASRVARLLLCTHTQCLCQTMLRQPCYCCALLLLLLSSSSYRSCRFCCVSGRLLHRSCTCSAAGAARQESISRRLLFAVVVLFIAMRVSHGTPALQVIEMLSSTTCSALAALQRQIAKHRSIMTCCQLASGIATLRSIKVQEHPTKHAHACNCMSAVTSHVHCLCRPQLQQLYHHHQALGRQAAARKATCYSCCYFS